MPEEKRKTNKEHIYIKIYIIALTITFAFCTGLGIYLKNSERKIEKEICSLKEFFARENKIIAKLQKLKEQEKETEKKIVTIIELQKNRKKVIKSIDLCLSHFPINKIYLTKYAIDLQKIEMTGFAINLTTIAQYMKALKRANQFQNITIERISRKSVDNYELVNFSLKLNYY